MQNSLGAIFDKIPCTNSTECFGENLKIKKSNFELLF